MSPAGEDILFDFDSMSPTSDGHIITLREQMTQSTPPFRAGTCWCCNAYSFLFCVWRVGGGQDMLETFESDDDSSSTPASDGVPPENSVDDNLNCPSLAAPFRPPKVSGHVNLTHQQAPPKYHSGIKKVFLYLRGIFDTPFNKIQWMSARSSTKEGIDSH